MGKYTANLMVFINLNPIISFKLYKVLIENKINILRENNDFFFLI